MIRSYFNIFRRWLWLLVLTTVVAGLVSYMAASRQPEQYSAKTKLLVGPAAESLSPELNDLRAAAQLLEVYAVLPTMRPFLETVIAELELDVRPSQLESNLNITTDTTTQILTIRVTDSDRDRAALIANAIADLLINRSPSGAPDPNAWDQLQGQIDRVEAVIAKSEARLAELEAALEQADTEAQRTQIVAQISDERNYLSEAERLLISLYTALQKTPNNQVSVVEPAERGKPIDRAIPLKTILGALGGLLFGGAIVLASEYFNDTIRQPDDLLDVGDVPALGSLFTRGGRRGSKHVRPLVLTHAASQAAERYRRLAMRLSYAAGGRERQILLIGDVAGNGSGGEVAANLAVVLAQLGENVVLVDADLRATTVTRIFEMHDAPGLTDLLADEVSLDDLLIPGEKSNGLAVLPSGHSTQEFFEVITSDRFAAVIERLVTIADRVVLAAPPLHTYAAGLVLAARADGTLVVVDSGHNTRQQLREVCDSLREVGAPIIGSILAMPGRAKTRRLWGKQASQAGQASRRRSTGRSESRSLKKSVGS